MILNRHFCIMVLSAIFIVTVIWWQQPVNVVTAMAAGGYVDDSHQLVKQSFQKMDYRQFDLAKDFMTEDAQKEISILEQRLKNNPFLSMRRIEIQNINPGTFLVKTIWGSSIDPQEEANYLVEVDYADIGLIITSIKAI